jgi:hypothetical protein
VKPGNHLVKSFVVRKRKYRRPRIGLPDLCASLLALDYDPPLQSLLVFGLAIFGEFLIGPIWINVDSRFLEQFFTGLYALTIVFSQQFNKSVWIRITANWSDTTWHLLHSSRLGGRMPSMPRDKVSVFRHNQRLLDAMLPDDIGQGDYFRVIRQNRPVRSSFSGLGLISSTGI